MNKPRYLLRHAAGMYWIIKTDQQRQYIKPILTNECGALIWNGIENGSGVEELSKILQKNYGIGPEEALADIISFLNQLTGNGMEAYLKEKGVLE